MGITRCRVCEATLQVWAGSEPEELRQVCGSCATAELRRLEKRVAELEGAMGEAFRDYHGKSVLFSARYITALKGGT